MEILAVVCTCDSSRHLHLPTYRMLEEPQEVNGRLVVRVEVPDECCRDGCLDEECVRAYYRGNPTWDRPGCLANVEVVE